MFAQLLTSHNSMGILGFISMRNPNRWKLAEAVYSFIMIMW
jgi:hypothetical protein